MPATVSAMTQPPPIIPGPEPQWQPPPPPHYPPAGWRPKPDGGVGKTATNTVVVVGVLILIFCGLPVVACGVLLALGSFSGGVSP